MRFTLILSLLLSVLAVVFALQNPERIVVAFGPFEIAGSTALILIVTFALGALVGILAMIPSRLKGRKKVKTLKKQITEQTAPPAAPVSPADAPSLDYSQEFEPPREPRLEN